MTHFSDAQIIDATNIRDIASDVLLPNGQIKLMPAKEWQQFDWPTFRTFCHSYARYGIPTTELICFLAEHIPDKKHAIEIGAGSGDLGHYLDIPMTDSRQQEDAHIKAQYRAMFQPTIKYPPSVTKLEALDAVKFFKPSTVIASWVTTYAPAPTPYGSNPWGIKEPQILELVDKFILIGNLDTHWDKPIMQIEHDEYYFDWLVSRGKNQKNNRIWIWQR